MRFNRGFRGMDWAFRGSNQAAGLDRTGGRRLGLALRRSARTSVCAGRIGMGSTSLAQERSGAHLGECHGRSLRRAPPIGVLVAIASSSKGDALWQQCRGKSGSIIRILGGFLVEGRRRAARRVLRYRSRGCDSAASVMGESPTLQRPRVPALVWFPWGRVTPSFVALPTSRAYGGSPVVHR